MEAAINIKKFIIMTKRDSLRIIEPIYIVPLIWKKKKSDLTTLCIL
jgi:hypothetical protein